MARPERFKRDPAAERRLLWGVLLVVGLVCALMAAATYLLIHTPPAGKHLEPPRPGAATAVPNYVPVQ